MNEWMRYRDSIKALIYSQMAYYKQFINFYVDTFKSWAMIQLTAWKEWVAELLPRVLAYVNLKLQAFFNGVIRGLRALQSVIAHLPKYLASWASAFKRGFIKGLDLLEKCLTFGFRAIRFLGEQLMAFLKIIPRICRFIGKLLTNGLKALITKGMRGLELLGRGFYNVITAGFRTLFNFISNFSHYLGRGISAVFRFAKALGNLFITVVKQLPRIFQYIGESLINGLKALVTQGLRGLELLGRGFHNIITAGFRTLFNFISNFSHYLGRGITAVFRVLDACFGNAFRFAKALGNLFIAVVKQLPSFCQHIGGRLLANLQALGHFVRTTAKFLLTPLATILKNFGTYLMQWVGSTVGVIYGLSAVSVDIAADILKGGLSFVGLNIGQYAAFGWLTTGLGFALTGFALYQVCKLSYIGISILVGSIGGQVVAPPVPEAAADNNVVPQVAPLPANAPDYDARNDAVVRNDNPPGYTPGRMRPSAPSEERPATRASANVENNHQATRFRRTG